MNQFTDEGHPELADALWYPLRHCSESPSAHRLTSFKELGPQDLGIDKLTLFKDFDALWLVTQILSHGFLWCGRLISGGEEPQQRPLRCLFDCQNPEFFFTPFSPSLEIPNEHCAGRNRQQNVSWSVQRTGEKSSQGHEMLSCKALIAGAWTNFNDQQIYERFCLKWSHQGNSKEPIIIKEHMDSTEAPLRSQIEVQFSANSSKDERSRPTDDVHNLTNTAHASQDSSNAPSEGVQFQESMVGSSKSAPHRLNDISQGPLAVHGSSQDLRLNSLSIDQAASRNQQRDFGSSWSMDLRNESSVLVRCDVCGKEILDSYWHCHICSGEESSFDMCGNCSSRGMLCHITGEILHALNRRFTVIMFGKQQTIDPTDELPFPLILACAVQGRTDIVRHAIDMHGDWDGTDKEGRTILHWAAKIGWEDMVRVILHDEKADPSRRDLDGKTPLHYASGNGHEGIMNCLLERSTAEKEIQDRDGHTPFDCAQKMGYYWLFPSLKTAS
jgi:hypothetical protein